MLHNKVLVTSLLLCGLAGMTPATVQAAPSESMATQAQQITASGIVEDAEGPLIGVTVTVKGNVKIATSTDIDGLFQLKVPAGSTLVFTYVGCKPVEMTAAADMKVSMSSMDEVLNEVVVVGFGTQKRANLTGAVSTVDTQLLNDRPLDNVAKALQGAVAGLNINVPSGALDDNPSINIRGVGTVGSGSSGSPLILIDGMEGDINAINPQDVASVSVLKDAAAASIYGSRAPFGVIMITTKKGSQGKASISYQNSFRWANPINMAHTMESLPFVGYFNDGCTNTNGWSPHFTGDHLQRIKDYYEGKITSVLPANGQYWQDGYAAGNANVDWYGEVFRDRNFSQEHNLSVSGGTEKISYYFSANYSDHDGSLRIGKNTMNNYNVTGRFTADVFKWLRLGYSTRWNRQDFRRPATLTDNLYQTLGRQGWPTLPIRDDNGFYYDSPSPALGLAEGGKDTKQTDRNTHQLELIFFPLQGWDIHAELNYNVLSATRHWDSLVRYNHDVEGNPYVYGDGSSNVHEDYYKENFFNVNLYTNYNWTVAEKNDFHVMLGFQTENMKQLAYGLQRNGILVPDLPVVDLTSGLSPKGDPVTPSVNGSRNEWDTAGFFGRINYSYDSRYLLEANLRYDGTSRFRSNRRWIWLPSFSAGWNIANEKFWEECAEICNQLKLRVSYGVLGNQNTTNWYQTYRVLDPKASDGGWLQGGLKPNTLAFPGLVSTELTWEKVYNWNIGLDFALLNSRLRGSFDYYIRSTKNMVGPAPELPAVLGTGVPYTNNCDLRTNGWDLEIGWYDNTSFGLSYSARFVLSDAITKITRYPNNPSNTLPEPNPNDPKRYIAGRTMGEIWGFETVGVAHSQAEMDAHLQANDQSQLGDNWAAGDIMYRDLDNNGVISSGANTLDDHGDLKVIGNSTPRFNFSLDLNASYYGFDVRLYFQGVAKRDYWQGSSYFWGIENNFWWSQGLNQHADYFRDENTWSVKEGINGVNIDSYYPRPVFDGGGKNKQVQTRYLQDASYIRLKNFQVGYSLPKNITKKIGFDLIRVYFSAENLWTGTHLSSLFDPETIGSGWGGCAYPLSRTFSFGINLNL